MPDTTYDAIDVRRREEAPPFVAVYLPASFRRPSLMRKFAAVSLTIPFLVASFITLIALPAAEAQQVEPATTPECAGD